MLERSACIGSSFRSAVVFPGGQLDLADEAPFTSPDGALLEMDIRNEAYMRALRLCAVRETFEETGLLLMPSSAQSAGMPLSRAVGYEEAGIKKEEWLAIRDQVHNDASQFVPFLHRVWAKLNGGQPSNSGETPIAAMSHHSNWVTPRSVVRPAKRFDAHFFLTCLDRPNVFGAGDEGVSASATDIGLAVDGTEATSFRLGSPKALLQAAFDDRHVLYPPQAYILADLAALIERHGGTGAGVAAGLPGLAPLVFGAGREQQGEGSGVTRVEEEARGLGGRNYTWERRTDGHKSTDQPGPAAAGSSSGSIPAQSAAWVSTDAAPFRSGSTSIQADIDLLREGVTAIEPHPLLKHGTNIPATPASTTSQSVVGGDAEEEEIFVFPLVLPGDHQASAAQRATAGNAPLHGRPLNRVFVSPRSREDGGGLVVKGVQRAGVGTLMDFTIGLALKCEEANEDDADTKQSDKKAHL